MMFSCRDQESSVQFVEPVQTSSSSRTTNLWCMRSGIPGTRQRLDGKRLDRDGRRLGRRRNGDRPRVRDVVEQPDRDATLLRREERREHEPARVRLEADVVQREVERALRLGEERRGQARRPTTATDRRPVSVVSSMPVCSIAGTAGGLAHLERLQ